MRCGKTQRKRFGRSFFSTLECTFPLLVLCCLLKAMKFLVAVTVRTPFKCDRRPVETLSWANDSFIYKIVATEGL